MKYIVGVIVVIIAAIAAVLMLSSGPVGTNTGTKPKQVVKLVDYVDKSGSEVSLTTQGRVVGESEFRSVRVTISKNSRKVEILKGYDMTVEKSEQFANSKTGYDVLLRSLANAGFSKTKTSSYSDERGVCPLGNRYVYLLSDNGN